MSFSKAVFKKGRRVKNTVTLIFIYFARRRKLRQTNLAQESSVDERESYKRTMSEKTAIENEKR